MSESEKDEIESEEKNDPRKELRILNEKQDKLEKQIFHLETLYLEENSNMMNGWSNLNVRSSGALSQIQKRKAKDEERIFTMSSARSRDKFIVPESFIKEFTKENKRKKFTK
eukprot:TRINITY_DN5254_c0_g1_i1.p1 TRINITY_DN5254_c0_g1~~TRINITY_DN5254_c0_g1_i1.p1  ORF type:complete len:112 (-),score=35.08 TRINITY_DN5254_c0_g1_i1:84-419(-)